MTHPDPGLPTPVNRADVRWEMATGAWSEIGALPVQVRANYKSLVRSFQESVCRFINTVDHCAGKANGISCVGGLPNGGKELKARCAVPGMGKSGGLRIMLAAYCDKSTVRVMSVKMRQDS